MILSSKKQKIWFTSDTHFGHKNILKYCPATRPVVDIVDHDRILIQNWREQVADNDIVFHLGDVAFSRGDALWNILNQLTGTIVLVKGNHDGNILKDPNMRTRFAGIHSDLTVYIDNQMVVLYHYPIAEHNQLHRGAFHFYGHVHGGVVPGMRGRVFDVGIDNRPQKDMKLWAWEDLYKVVSQMPAGVREH